ncbi:pilus assembly protein TadG-related protein [Rhodosalinus sp.]|uniref:pilus assembly protein TadG-related protein n=1 Tax=Rhodosalinus sp. TaxID=2047741 RepID=UPI00397ABB53
MAIWAIFMLMMMLMAGSAGIDFMLAEMRRAQLQSILDRAVLAAADLDQMQDPEAVVQSYMEVAGLEDYLGDVKVESGLNYRRVSADLSMKQDTLLLKMLGTDDLLLAASGTAEEVIPNTEISLVLDISGSMRRSNRMDNLKPAAREFVRTVLRGDAGRTTSINLVPYAGQTNPGREMFSYLEGVRYGSGGGDHFPRWEHDISNVVFYYDRDKDGEIDHSVKIKGFPSEGGDTHISNDLDDFFHQINAYITGRDNRLDADTPVIGASIKDGKQKTSFFRYAGNTNGPAADSGPTQNTGKGPDRKWNYSHFFKNRPDAEPGGMPQVSSCLEMDERDFDTVGLVPRGRDQVPHFMYWPIASNVMDWGWCPEDDTRIQYAQNEAGVLEDFIENMRMHDGTGTHYAIKWALALLDPDTRPAFEHLSGVGQVPDRFSDRPSAWNAEGWSKVIVLMTDGQITEQIRPVDPLDPENAVTELQRRDSEHRTEITSGGTNVRSFYEQCDLAKRNGVTIYTIAFEAPSGARREMSNCASSPAHFFDVDGIEISDAFSAIARQINQLRLIQ